MIMAAVKAHGTSIGNLIEQNAQQSRLAGAVLADESRDFAACQLGMDAPENFIFSQPHADVVQGDQRCHLSAWARLSIFLRMRSI